MEPENQNTNQQGVPRQPTVTPSPNPTPVATPTASSMIPTATGKKKSKLILPIIAGVVFLLLTAGIVLFILFGRTSEAKNVSNNFMNAATQGDVQQLLEQPGTDESNRDFLTNIAQNFEGSYKLLESTKENGKYYFLYELSDAKTKYARLIVEDDNGWGVTGVVYSNDKLALVPKTVADTETTAAAPSSSTPDTPTAPVTPTTPVATVTPCLVQSDYKYMMFDKNIPTVDYTKADETGWRSSYVDDMFFEPDSIVESIFLSTYDDWAEFAIKNASKNWTFTLNGGVNDRDGTIDAASITLANQRTAKVTRELITRGVAPSKIIDGGLLDQTDAYAPNYSKIYRRVRLTIDNPCNVDGYTPTPTPTSNGI